MKLVDVHAHLGHARFRTDLDDVLERFREEGGGLVIESGINPATNRKALEIARNCSLVGVSFGLYPIDALAKEVENGESGFIGEPEGFSVDEEMAWIEKHAGDCIAIGEIGLDYNWKEFQTEEMREKQKEVFRKVLGLAKKIGKPVVVHSRKAEEDAIGILEELGMKKVIMHSFNGKKSLIRRCIENGWSFSIPPVIIRLEHFKMLADMVPLGQLLTETDCPYLSPVAGERNEPSNVVVTIKEIARIKGVSVEEVSEKIWENAKGLFFNVS